jgi:ribosomal protein S18 acetylase RimI-like enzyme
MPMTVEDASITRITDISQLNIQQFNTLLDEDKVWDEEQARLFLSKSDNALFVAFFENREIGFVSAYRLQRFDNLKAEVFLYEIGVDEAFRRQGVGSLLISSIKKWATKVGAAEIWVLTEEDNKPAKLFYGATGGIEESINSTMFTFLNSPYIQTIDNTIGVGE